MNIAVASITSKLARVLRRLTRLLFNMGKSLDNISSVETMKAVRETIVAYRKRRE